MLPTKTQKVVYFSKSIFKLNKNSEFFQLKRFEQSSLTERIHKINQMKIQIKRYLATILSVTTAFGLFAQEFPEDSISQVKLQEVIIISGANSKLNKEAKSLGSIDNYLEKSDAVNMIKRGAYGWEPMLQGMATERSVITIDGMRIYSACTDKMDPITSYVEISNFSKADIVSGSSAGVHGGTIAGSIDLIRKKSGFDGKGFGGSAFGGFETVNKQKILGTGLSYSTRFFFSNIDFTWRDADNYKAGGDKEILYSQFTKYNLSAITGIKITDNQSIEASVIYDKAADVGYPALPMDVSLAEAGIASVQYNYKNLSERIDLWETKIYYNTVKHIMDDSHRPSVPIRMDMPGWSKTAGFYSKINGNFKQHNYGLILSAHQNNSLAEMIMHPNNQEESDMYMMTWPDVNTLYSGLFFEDKIKFGHHLILKFSSGIGFHRNSFDSESGMSILQVLYPGMKSSKNRFIKSLNSTVSLHQNQWLFSFGVGYSERAPTISEGYGFYLFNSSDAYDYIGNPFLKNEKSIEFSTSAQYKTTLLNLKWQGNYFHIFDYILGKPDNQLIPMTIGANGIKVYESLEFARIFNTGLEIEYRIARGWYFDGRVSYRYGEGFEKNKLPLIQPLNYRFELRFERKKWIATVNLNGSSKNNRYNPEFGETPKKSYLIMNLAGSKTFLLNNQKIVVKLGAENIFDKNYTTFSDWNNIPRPGRNFFVNLIYNW